jgi:hypothetical protein
MAGRVLGRGIAQVEPLLWHCRTVALILVAATLLLLLVPGQARAIVYWGNSANGQYNFGANEFGVWVGRAGMDGGNVDPYFVRTGLRTRFLDAQGGHLFWAFGCRPPARGDVENDCRPPGVVGRVGVDGSGLNEALVDQVRDDGVIGTDSTHVYWIEDPFIARARLDGTEVDHAWYDAEDALDPSFVGVPNDLEVDGSYIYVLSQYAITRIALDRSSYLTHFVPLGDICCASGMAIDDTYIYFGWSVSGQPATIGRVLKDGTGLDKTWLAGPYTRAHDVEVNSTHIYWSDEGRAEGPGGAIGRARTDGSAVEREFITTPPGVTSFFPAGLALDDTPTAPVPPERPDPTATGVGSGAPPPGSGGGISDPTVGASTVCVELREGVKRRTRSVAGGGQVVMTVGQSQDPSVPVKITVRPRGGVQIASAAFKVGNKPVDSTGTTANVPVNALRLGRGNRITVTVTLADGRRVTVREFIVPRKCAPPPVTCKRLSEGARLRCSSTMPRRARRVTVSVAGPGGVSAKGTARVKVRKGQRRGTYSLTMTPSATLPPGKYLYKQVMTTTRKGERVLATRILTLR